MKGMKIIKMITEEEKKRLYDLELIGSNIKSIEYGIINETLNIESKFKVDNRRYNIDNRISLGNKYSRKFGGYDEIYADGCTLENFFISIIKNENYSSAMNVYKEIVREAKKKFKVRNIKITHKRVQTLIDYFTLYTRWVGFTFEYNLKKVLEEKGFKIEEVTRITDREYKIDIIISNENLKRIGIQCKSNTFLNGKIKGESISNYIKKNIEGQKRALRNGEVDEVYYIFHNDCGEIARVIDKAKAFGKNLIRCFTPIESIENSYSISPIENVFNSKGIEEIINKEILNIKKSSNELVA